MSSFTDFDPTGSRDISEHVSVDGGVLNLFDRKPPFDPINHAAINCTPAADRRALPGDFSMSA